MPTGMLAWRKPFVFENISSFGFAVVLLRPVALSNNNPQATVAIAIQVFI
jgi:hypothetical protein